MALVRRIEEGASNSRQHPTETECTFHLAYSDDGAKLLTLNTYGSQERKIAGKVSQTIQFDQHAAAELYKLILRTFPELKQP